MQAKTHAKQLCPEFLVIALSKHAAQFDYPSVSACWARVVLMAQSETTMLSATSQAGCIGKFCLLHCAVKPSIQQGHILHTLLVTYESCHKPGQPSTEQEPGDEQERMTKDMSLG